jgi:hypothetical protein
MELLFDLKQVVWQQFLNSTNQYINSSAQYIKVFLLGPALAGFVQFSSCFAQFIRGFGPFFLAQTLLD